MTDWQTYVAGFHARCPGISEDVLVRTTADGLSPYDWVARAVASEAERVLDLACGSGVMGRVLAEAVPHRPTEVVGLDLSEAELRRAAAAGYGGGGGYLRLVRGDGLRLPFAGQTFDAVTCSMAMMVFDRYAPALAECARVLKPGGVLGITVPSAVPLRPSDVRLLTQVTARLRSFPQFPGGAELTGLREAVEANGFRLLEDARERFAFPVHDRSDADLLIRSLYLPGTPDRRRNAAAAFLAERAVDEGGGLEIAVPIRRLVAVLKAE